MKIASSMMTTHPRLRAAFETFARLGYAARGVLYLIIGASSGMAALSMGGGTTDTTGALTTLLDQPLGRIATGALALGLVGYAAWRGTQAIFDIDAHGTDLQGVAIRLGLTVSAFTHALLAFTGLDLAIAGFSFGGGGGGSGKQAALGWLMQLPAGPVLVGLIGILVMGAGCAQIYRGLSMRYRPQLQVSARRMRLLTPLCTFGLIARGVVFALIGMLVMLAAVNSDPSQPVGLGQALSWLRDRPYGSMVFAVAALGLFAFGIYSLVEAAWRRIDLRKTSPAT